MGWQTLSDLEEILQFEDKAGFGPNLSFYPQSGAEKTEIMTAEQWLDRNTGWCEPYKARISPDACKLRKVSEMSDFCMVCKGIRKRSGKPVGGTRLPERVVT